MTKGKSGTGFYGQIRTLTDSIKVDVERLKGGDLGRAQRKELEAEIDRQKAELKRVRAELKSAQAKG